MHASMHVHSRIYTQSHTHVQFNGEKKHNWHIIYINDLPNASAFFAYILFADDTNILAIKKDERTLRDRVNSELIKLSNWFALNRLSLNYVKTEYINFSKTCKTLNETEPSIEIDDSPISKVKECKFLGVYLDSNISWRKHNSNVIRKISQTVSILGRARRFMDSPQMILLYNTMVLPHLQYCLTNWGDFKEDRNLKYRDRLLRLHKCFVRIIHGASRLSHADPLFAQSNALKIDDLFKQSIRCFSFKLSKNMLPSRMAALGSRITHSYRTRGSQINLNINCSDHRSLRYIAPNHWNPLSMSLKQSPSISSFKANSKKELLSTYSKFVCTTPNCPSCPPSVSNPR